jgi:hypothetical protein
VAAKARPALTGLRAAAARFGGRGGRMFARARAAVVARRSWPSRSRRSALRAMSSSNVVPTIWAIKPIRTARCASKISCNGVCAELAVSFVKPTGCAIMRSCNGVCAVLFVSDAEPMGCATKRSCSATPARRPLRMARPPRVDPADVYRAAESGLASQCAWLATLLGRSAGGDRAVTLVMTATWIATK